MGKVKENPLYQAFINKDYETIKELLASENAKKLVHDFDPEKSALHFAAENGYTSLLKRIIDLGILPNIVDLDGNTPLHLAADNEHIDSIRELVSQGSNIIVQNRKGNTPLHWVALDTPPYHTHQVKPNSLIILVYLRKITWFYDIYLSKKILPNL